MIKLIYYIKKDINNIFVYNIMSVMNWGWGIGR